MIIFNIREDDYETNTNRETNIMSLVSEQFGEVRATIRDGEPWFVAADLCRALSLDQLHKAL